MNTFPAFTTSIRATFAILIIFLLSLNKIANANEHSVPAMEINKGSASSIYNPKDQIEMVKIINEEFISGDKKKAAEVMFLLAKKTKNPDYAKMATVYASQNKDLMLSFDAVHLWIDLDPNDSQALRAEYSLGQVVPEVNNFAQDISEELKESQNKITIFNKIKRITSVMQDQRYALKLAQQVIKPYDNYAEGHAILSALYLNLKERKTALEEILKARAIKPDSETIFLQYYRLISPSNAEQGMNEANLFISTYPHSSAAVQLFVAHHLIQSKKAYEAYQLLLKTRKNYPNDIGVAYYLGALLFDYKNYNEAKIHLTDALSMQGPDTNAVLSRNPNTRQEALNLLNTIAIEQRDYQAALGYMNDPNYHIVDSIENHIQQSLTLARAGHYGEAMKNLNSFITTSAQQKTLVLVAKSQVIEEEKGLLASIHFIEDRLSYEKFNTRLLLRAAELYKKNNQINAAINTYEKIIAIDKNSAKSYAEWSKILYEKNTDKEKALALIIKSTTINPNNAEYINLLSELKLKLNQTEEALKWQTKAYSISSRAEYAIKLAGLLWIQGDKDKAKKIWQDVYLISPNNQDLQIALSQLNISRESLESSSTLLSQNSSR